MPSGPPLFVIAIVLSTTAAFASASSDCQRYSGAGNWTAAEGCYTAALQRNADPQTLRRAIEVYRKALSLRGANRDRVYNLALALFRAGQFPDSLSVLQQYPDTGAERHALQGANWRALGDIAKALPSLKLAASLEPDNEGYRSDYALALLRAGLEAAATAELQDATRRLPRSARLQSVLGVIAYGNGRNSEAVELYRKAISFEPSAADLRVSLGDVYHAIGKLEEAGAAYAAATKLAPADVGYLVKQGINFLHLQRKADAVKSFERALTYDGDDLAAHFQLGKIAAADGDDRNALKHLSKVASSPGSPPEALYQLSQVYRRMGRKEEAVATLKLFQQRKQATRSWEKEGMAQ